MYRAFFLISIFVFSCADPAKKEAEREAAKKQDSLSTIQANDANASIDTPVSQDETLPAPAPVKKPRGIYQVTVPLKNKIEQTIAFNSDFTYQLQEKYPGKKDSIVVTTGTWTPSDGYIWLYKEQVVRGRYKWMGDTLQYFSPLLKKSFSMNHLTDAGENKVWANKGKLGVLVYGVGNEPFWSVEVNNKNSLSFQLSDWDHPVSIKLASASTTQDSTSYTAQNDSIQLQLIVYPYFCSDGMSDFTYRNKIKVVYNHQVLKGCGIVYR